MSAARSTFSTSPSTTVTFSYSARVSASSGGRRLSTSTATTFFARRASSLVSTPTPGPTSSTPKRSSIPAASAILGQMPGLTIKFCPNSLESEKPCAAHSVLMVEISVRFTRCLLFFLGGTKTHRARRAVRPAARCALFRRPGYRGETPFTNSSGPRLCRRLGGRRSVRSGRFALQRGTRAARLRSRAAL